MGVPWCWSVLVHRHSWSLLGAGLQAWVAASLTFHLFQLVAQLVQWK